MNDYLSVMDGAEAFFINVTQQYLEGESMLGFELLIPIDLLVENYRQVGFDLFLLRLPNVLMFLLVILSFFGLGRKLFGARTMLLSILIVSSTFLIVPVTKFIGLDIWLLACQLIGFLSLILLLKKPSWKWRALFWICTLFAIRTNPNYAAFYSIGMWLFLMIFHPEGKNLRSPLDILLGILAIGFTFLVNTYLGSFQYDWFFEVLFIRPENYFYGNLIGILPWIGFLPAVFWDLFQKLKKKEEMAIILSGFLLFSILSFGLILQVVLALLIAKQIENYFKPNYPYSNLIKSFAVLSVIFSFFVVAFFLMSGYDQFREIGFRSRMGVAGVYWAFGFFGIIGLIGKDRKMMVGGFSLSGMLGMLLFWAQIVPLLENYRNFPLKIVEAIEEVSDKKDEPVFFYEPFFELPLRNQIYLRSKKINYSKLDKNQTVEDLNGLLVLSDSMFLKLDSTFLENIGIIEITGRNGIFEEDQKVWVLKREVSQ